VEKQVFGAETGTRIEWTDGAGNEYAVSAITTAFNSSLYSVAVAGKPILTSPEELQGQRIAILGFGREGVAAYRWLKARLTDCRIQLFTETPPELAVLGQLAPEDLLHVGSLDGAKLEAFDVLLRSPGISPYRPALQRAKAAGVHILSPSTLWFANNPEARTLCVTGTKGKSTTSALIAHMLRACGMRVQLAGNIGTALLACESDGVDWWVIELSSYQLCDLQGQPELGILLNLSPEHLDWHGGVENYMRDKLRLAELTAKGGLIVNAADTFLQNKFASDSSIHWFNSSEGIWVEGRQFMDGERQLSVVMPANMPGKHNRSNVAAALTAIRRAGFDLETAIESLATFQSLPHRLQVLGQRDGVSWINDSISSTPVATAAALEALSGRSIILLIGGLDRGLDWASYLPDFINNAPKALIAMPDNGPAVANGLKKLGLACRAGQFEVQSLEEAIRLAGQLATEGDTVLLSPGAPSFPRFVDFQHRGLEFARLAGF